MHKHSKASRKWLLIENVTDEGYNLYTYRSNDANNYNCYYIYMHRKYND
jgi:hypothetical protein